MRAKETVFIWSGYLKRKRLGAPPGSLEWYYRGERHKAPWLLSEVELVEQDRLNRRALCALYDTIGIRKFACMRLATSLR